MKPLKLAMFVMILVVLAGSVNAERQQVYVLTLEYDEGVISSEGVIVTQGVFNGPINSTGDYLLQLLSFDDDVLYSERFDFYLDVHSSAPPEWFDEEGNQIFIPQSLGVEQLNVSSKELIIPYFRNGARIDIFGEENEKVLEVSVKHYADLCGDGVCQDDVESYDSCLADCRSGSKDDYCDGLSDGLCDPDCTAREDYDCVEEAVADDGAAEAGQSGGEQSGSSFVKVAVVAGGLFVAVVLLALLFMRMRGGRNQNPPQASDPSLYGR